MPKVDRNSFIQNYIVVLQCQAGCYTLYVHNRVCVESDLYTNYTIKNTHLHERAQLTPKAFFALMYLLGIAVSPFIV